MKRTRTDGTKFQEEVKRGLAKFSVPLFEIRLHTNIVRSISDFIILTDKMIILEVKETSAKSFSTFTMQQHEKIEEFREFHRRAIEVYNSIPVRLYILVHFIKYDVYVVYDLLEKDTIVKIDSDGFMRSQHLQDALEYIL